jgi:hypothetical protein
MLRKKLLARCDVTGDEDAGQKQSNCADDSVTTGTDDKWYDSKHYMTAYHGQ